MPCNIVKIGKSPRGGDVEIEISLEEKEGKGPVLSMVGNVWLPSRRDVESCGQNYGHLKADIATRVIPRAQLDRMLAVWERWHLNDMRAGCEHQRAAWDVSEQVTVTSYTWSTDYHTRRRKAKDGTLTEAEYRAYRNVTERVMAATIGFNTPKYPTEEIKALLAEGWIKEEKTETKAAGWVGYQEHPRGLLSKPCDECGYRYGSGWLYEAIPAEVLAEIQSWL